MSYYSSNGVDQFLAPILPAVGYAVDVGANNGTALSNSKHFEDKGWTVLCCEANTWLEKEGMSCRKLWRSVAVGSKDQDKVVFEIAGTYPWAAISGMHLRESPGFARPPGWDQMGQPTAKLEVPMRTLNTLLTEVGFPKLDYLTVDVEGHELEVLKGIDLKIWKPLVIVAECWTADNAKSVINYLTDQGYILDEILEFDHCFLRQST